MVDPIAPEPAPLPSVPPEDERIEELQGKIAAAEAEVLRLSDEFLRAKAETENVRRRAAEDVARAHKFGVESFASSLLAVKDGIEAALAVESPTIESLRQGIEITLRQLSAAFDKFSIAEIAAQGEKFDPHCHEAMRQVESDQDPNTVVKVMQKGYRLHDRVIRPALVMVAGEGAAPAEERPQSP